MYDYTTHVTIGINSLNCATSNFNYNPRVLCRYICMHVCIYMYEISRARQTSFFSSYFWYNGDSFALSCWLVVDVYAKIHVACFVTYSIFVYIAPREKRETRSYNYDTLRVRIGIKFFNKFQVAKYYGGLVAELAKNSQRHARVEMSSSANFIVIYFIF